MDASQNRCRAYSGTVPGTVLGWPRGENTGQGAWISAPCSCTGTSALWGLGPRLQGQGWAWCWLLLGLECLPPCCLRKSCGCSLGANPSSLVLQIKPRAGGCLQPQFPAVWKGNNSRICLEGSWGNQMTQDADSSHITAWHVAKASLGCSGPCCLSLPPGCPPPPAGWQGCGPSKPGPGAWE